MGTSLIDCWMAELIVSPDRKETNIDGFIDRYDFHMDEFKQVLEDECKPYRTIDKCNDARMCSFENIQIYSELWSR